MAVVAIPDEHQILRDTETIASYLAAIGVDYQRWQLSQIVSPDAEEDEILTAYADDIEALKASGDYENVDVVGVNAQTPGLEEILAGAGREHWHEESEARLILQGRGVFYVRPRQGPVVAIEVVAGDLIRVPLSTWHWFILGSERLIRMIRFFGDPSLWSPHYTESGIERGYQTFDLSTACSPE